MIRTAKCVVCKELMDFTTTSELVGYMPNEIFLIHLDCKSKWTDELKEEFRKEWNLKVEGLPEDDNHFSAGGGDGAAKEADDEAAHSMEDEFRDRILVLISEGHPKSKELADWALSTNKLKFSRWCA
jgi:hypothetical protein